MMGKGLTTKFEGEAIFEREAILKRNGNNGYFWLDSDHLNPVNTGGMAEMAEKMGYKKGDKVPYHIIIKKRRKES